MKRMFIFIATAALLSGCAANGKRESQDSYSRLMESYVGAPESFLIDKWGPPDRVYETEDAKYLTYTSSRIVPVPAPMPVGARAPFPIMYGGSISMNCTSTFKIINGVIVHWRYRGNAC